MELQVVWNGAHGNCDGDLLCCPAIPLKRYDAPEPEPLADCRDLPGKLLAHVHAAVWACLQHGAWTAQELHVATGFPKGEIQLALTRLRKQFAVILEPMPPEERSHAAWLRYRLVRG